MRDFNPQLWFGSRKMTMIPRHFVRSSTPVTEESLQWVEDKLMGRYGIVSEANLSGPGGLFSILFQEVIYFESPKDLMMYELYWAGKNNF